MIAPPGDATIPCQSLRQRLSMANTATQTFLNALPMTKEKLIAA